CDHGLAALNGGPHRAIGRINTAQRLDDQVNVFSFYNISPVRNQIDAIRRVFRAVYAFAACPRHTNGSAVSPLSNFSCVARQDFRGRASYGAVADNANANFFARWL